VLRLDSICLLTYLTCSQATEQK